MVDGESAIWQVVAAASDGTEGNVGDPPSLVLFNVTPIETAGQIIKGGEYSIRDSIPEVPRVFADGNEVQDMGLDGVNIRLTGLIRTVNDISADTTMNKIMTWKRDAQTVPGFTQGRFGLRLNDFPAFNIIPTSTYGGKLQDLRFIRDPDNLNNTEFEITVRVGGNITSWLLSNGF